MDTKRIYRGKDIEMLIVLSVLVGYALQNLAFLSTKRSNWDQKFFDNLLAKIDAVVKKHTGYDSALSLRNATKVVTNIMKPAYRALSEFKVQVEQDFKKEKDFLKEILNSLGFQDHFAVRFVFVFQLVHDTTNDFGTAHLGSQFNLNKKRGRRGTKKEEEKRKDNDDKEEREDKEKEGGGGGGRSRTKSSSQSRNHDNKKGVGKHWRIAR